MWVSKTATAVGWVCNFSVPKERTVTSIDHEYHGYQVFKCPEVSTLKTSKEMTSVCILEMEKQIHKQYSFK